MSLPSSLDFGSVNAALAEGAALVAGGTLDLSAVSRADSAGIALLLELTRLAQARGIQLKIQGANSQIRSLLTFFKLNEVLVLV